MTQNNEPYPGVLYIVGTPIGNLSDLSPRAISILQKVSFIACEDTRRSKVLLNKSNIKNKLLSFHRHNTQNRIPKLLSLLRNKESLALISDAGLPGICDPGEELVKAATDSGHNVICIPGPCAATTALVSSGLPSSRFCFEGFLPNRKKARKEILKEIASEKRTTIIYESPHHLVHLLKELLQLCGEERPLKVSRELTKFHEEQIGFTIKEVLEYFQKNKPIGECTVLLGGVSNKVENSFSESKLLTEMNFLIQNGFSYSEAARELSKRTGISRRFLYSLLHNRSNENIQDP